MFGSSKPIFSHCSRGRLGHGDRSLVMEREKERKKQLLATVKHGVVCEMTTACLVHALFVGYPRGFLVACPFFELPCPCYPGRSRCSQRRWLRRHVEKDPEDPEFVRGTLRSKRFRWVYGSLSVSRDACLSVPFFSTQCVFRQQAWRFFLDNPILTANKDPENDRLSQTRDDCYVFPSASCGASSTTGRLALHVFCLVVWLCDLLFRALALVFSGRFPVLNYRMLGDRFSLSVEVTTI